jgi:hypothetical protein
MRYASPEPEKQSSDQRNRRREAERESGGDAVGALIYMVQNSRGMLRQEVKKLVQKDYAQQPKYPR